MPRLWDLKTGYEVAKLEADFRYGFSADLAAGGKQLAIGDEDGEVVVWEASVNRDDILAWHERLAEAAESEGRWAEVRHQLDEILRQREPTAKLLVRRGIALFSLGDVTAAEADLRQADQLGAPDGLADEFSMAQTRRARPGIPHE